MGRFQVILNGKAITSWPSKKAKEVFAYLAYYHNRPVYRDVLMDKFWPDSDPESARNCLNVALHTIRSLFQKYGPEFTYIQYKDEQYLIDSQIGIRSDVEEFLYYWRIAQSTEREKGLKAALCEYELAAALYNGDFMEDDLYENWFELDRENLKETYLIVLDKISECYSLDGKPDTAISLCSMILEKDRCREDIHQRMMKCYSKLGKRDKALKQYKKCAEVLEAELEVEPTQDTVKLYEQIRQNCAKP